MCTWKLVDGLRGVPGFLRPGKCLPVVVEIETRNMDRMVVQRRGGTGLQAGLMDAPGGHPGDTSLGSSQRFIYS